MVYSFHQPVIQLFPTITGCCFQACNLLVSSAVLAVVMLVVVSIRFLERSYFNALMIFSVLV